MNKHLKIALATCLTVALLAGCAPSSESVSTTDENTSTKEVIADTDSKEDISTTDNEASSTPTKEEHAFIQLFSEFMNSNPSAIEIAAFMEDNLELATPDEANIVLSRLLLAQNQIRYDWFDMISDDRLTGFQDMDNQWRLENIENIENEVTKKKYEDLKDAYLRIVTYEETPVVETDWTRLQGFSDSLSKSVNLMIDLNKKVQNYEYGAYPHDFSAMADDILKLEEAIYARSSDFMTSQMNTAYNNLISEMFYSIEGINMEYWRDLEGPLVAVLKDVAESHGQTNFGKLSINFIDLVENLDNDNNSFDQVGNLISSHNAFGLQNSLGVEMDSIYSENLSRNIERIEIPHNPTAEEKINTAIKQWFHATENKFGWSENSKVRMSEDSFGSFVVGNYYGVTLYASITNPNGQYESTQNNVLFDMKTGKAVSLESFLGKPHSVFSPVLLKSLKANYSDQFKFIENIDTLPEDMSFTLDEYGLVLSFSKHELTDAYDYDLSLTVPYDDLYDIFDVMTLY